MKPKFWEYEYWPYWMFYAPFVPFWIWKSIRSGSFSYFCKANPGIEFGGFLDYSKFKILSQLPDEFIPKTRLITHKSSLNELPNFPFVVKPDLGERGVNVEVINSKSDWKNYPLQENLIIQEFVDLPFEFGIFYVKTKGNGKLLSITGKEFMVFKSDGQMSLKDFVLSNPRIMKRENYFSKKFKNEWDIILPIGTEMLLEPIGNHNRGTRFFDASELISKELTAQISQIADKIQGFNYGRFDVKAASEEDLKNGKFTVLEVNGVNSEPTHIYDSKFSLWQAYSEVKRHLDIQFEISRTQSKNYSSRKFYYAVIKRLMA